jgi:alpha-glucoside transport system permease protein
MAARGQSATVASPSGGAPPARKGATHDPDRRRRYLAAVAFLAPAAVFLGVWVVYPTVYTVIRSFFDATGQKFVGLGNYQTLFTTNILLTAIKNNAIWVLVVPALVTAIGLVFAVLTERIRWSVAFKTAVFMPMAISLFATGVIWHLMYVQDPSLGTVNAGIAAVKDLVQKPGVLPGATPSTNGLKGTPKQGFVQVKAIQPGSTALVGLTGIPATGMPQGAQQAVKPEALQGGISGVVWRDFKPGGGKPGVVEQGELGIPGVTLELRDASGSVAASTVSASDGSFKFPDIQSGSYRVGIAASTFAKPFAGVPWLGTSLITPSIIIAYTWVWAGFAMVVIAAGLAAIPRDVLEAARTDGASEWQVFRRVTVPLLWPVLTVVFITMAINVLKVFDIVLSVAPGSSQAAANVIALAMWRTSFGGSNNFGLGSAIAVFLFILVIPVLWLNIRRFRKEG